MSLRVKNLVSVGSRHGLLVTVKLVKKDERYKWLCRCDCGGEHIVRNDHLLSGYITNCGCQKAYELTGQRFGYAVVLGPSKRWKTSKAAWNCLCDCGKEFDRSASELLRVGSGVSCGCKKSALTINRAIERNPHGVVASAKYRSLAGKSRTRNLEFSLSIEEFKDLSSQCCHYCGKTPQEKKSNSGVHESFYMNGLDRVDNNLGYVMGNVVPCCKQCNVAKNKGTEGEFLAMCNNTAKRHPIKVVHNRSNWFNDAQDTSYIGGA